VRDFGRKLALVDFGIRTPKYISIGGNLISGFAVAQPDLANGAQFQVQMKKHLTLFHQNMESCAVRKIRMRLRYSESTISVRINT
jgi:hypothetical protein